MKKKGILLAVVLLFSAAGLVQAEEGKLSGTIDATYMSSYIWRGFDMYGESRSTVQPSIDVDLYGTGFGLNVFYSRANGSGKEDLEELRTTLYYQNGIYEAENYATSYKVGWTYYNYPDGSTKDYDMQEFFAALSWPNICPAGVVPSYTVVCSWPSEGNSRFANDSGGWLHIFGLGYDLAVSSLLPETPEQTLHLSADFVYNDGAWDFVSPGGSGTVDHDWSHVLFGLSTGIDLSENLTLTPGLYYQLSMDDSVNDEDEIWVTLGVSYKF